MEAFTTFEPFAHVRRWCDRCAINGPLAIDAMMAFATAFGIWRKTGGRRHPQRVLVARHASVHQRETPVSLPTYKPLDLELNDPVTGRTFACWDPLTERWDDAERRILEEFAECLRTAMISRQLECSELPILDDTPKKRSSRHFDWLVRFQMLGESRSQIAVRYGVARPQLGQAIAQTAELVGLELRPQPGGRPKNKKARTIKIP